MLTCTLTLLNYFCRTAQLNSADCFAAKILLFTELLLFGASLALLQLCWFLLSGAQAGGGLFVSPLRLFMLEVLSGYSPAEPAEQRFLLPSSASFLNS